MLDLTGKPRQIPIARSFIAVRAQRVGVYRSSWRILGSRPRTRLGRSSSMELGGRRCGHGYMDEHSTPRCHPVFVRVRSTPAWCLPSASLALAHGHAQTAHDVTATSAPGNRSCPLARPSRYSSVLERRPVFSRRSPLCFWPLLAAGHDDRPPCPPPTLPLVRDTWRPRCSWGVLQPSRRTFGRSAWSYS